MKPIGALLLILLLLVAASLRAAVPPELYSATSEHDYGMFLDAGLVVVTSTPLMRQMTDLALVGSASSGRTWSVDSDQHPAPDPRGS